MSRILSSAALLAAGFASSAAVAQYPPPTPSSAQLHRPEYNAVLYQGKAMVTATATVSSASDTTATNNTVHRQGLAIIEYKDANGNWITASNGGACSVAPKANVSGQPAQTVSTNQGIFSPGVYTVRMAIYGSSLAGASDPVQMTVNSNGTISGDWGISVWNVTLPPN